MHFAAYLVAACLMQRCFSSRWRPRYAAGYAGLILLGGLDELTQALVTRTPSVYDFLADAAGIISCLVVALTAPSIRNYFVNKQLRQSTDTAENVFVDPNELSE